MARPLPDIKADVDALLVLLILPSDLKTLATAVRDLVETLVEREVTRNLSALYPGNPV
jgi:hypothetical protein